jgi:hypothetical protein
MTNITTEGGHADEKLVRALRKEFPDIDDKRASELAQFFLRYVQSIGDKIKREMK